MSSTAVVVPVMRRPQNAAPFMGSLRASGADCTVYAIADAEDVATRAAWEAERATVLISERGSRFAQKVNHGYYQTVEPWLFLVGDDVRFHHGWLEAALEAAGDQFSMVATNDLGNPWVMSGVHATHPLVRRSWVEESGACWDGPGVVAHEGYVHAWCDNEWSAKAINEGVFVYAPAAVVAHIHPTWGHGELDEVYRLGISNLPGDGALFRQRAEMYA